MMSRKNDRSLSHWLAATTKPSLRKQAALEMQLARPSLQLRAKANAPFNSQDGRDWRLRTASGSTLEQAMETRSIAWKWRGRAARRPCMKISSRGRASHFLKTAAILDFKQSLKIESQACQSFDLADLPRHQLEIHAQALPNIFPDTTSSVTVGRSSEKLYHSASK